jgi:hypothetical protein
VLLPAPAPALAPEPVPPPEPAPLPSSPSPMTSPPTLPPMSVHLPSDPFKVICRLCFKYSHEICYRQCPNCYQGTNYCIISGNNNEDRSECMEYKCMHECRMSDRINVFFYQKENKNIKDKKNCDIKNIYFYASNSSKAN